MTLEAVSMRLLAMIVAGAVAVSAATPCAFKVRRERDPRPGERPYAETLPYAPVKGHRNEAPGPDSLLLVSRTTRGFYPRVYLESRRDGSRRCLEPRGWSEIPSWSPNGRWFAYVHKDTIANLENLVVGTPKTPRCANFDRTVDIVDYWWSPDSRAIALYGRDRTTRAVTLYVFWPASRTSWRVDQLGYFLDYDASWSPSSRFLAFSRPDGVNNADDITSGDILLADPRVRRICRLVHTTDRVELEPQWCSDSTLQCTVYPVRNEAAGAPREVVLELTAPDSSRR